MIKASKRSLKSVLDSELGPRGFKRKASSWYRQAKDVLQVVDLQKSNYGLQFYLNICFVPAGMEVDGMPTPKEHKCPIRIRLGAVYPEHRDGIQEAFDLERTSLSDAQRQERLAWISRELMLSFLERIGGVDDLRMAIDQGAFAGGGVTLAAKSHLGII